MTDPNAGALSFCAVLEEMISANRTQDREGREVEPRGLSTVNNLVVLNRLHREMRSNSTLEIGLAFGASALVFGQGHKDFGLPPEGQHIAIDPFQDHVAHAGLAAIARAGLAGYVHHIVARSDRALPQLLEQGKRFGIIYIDGSHLFEDVVIDSHYAAQLLVDGGVMLMDDSSDEHVAKVLGFVRGNLTQVFSEIDLTPYRLDKGASLSYKIAKLMNRVQLTGFRKVGNQRRHFDAKLRSF